MSGATHVAPELGKALEAARTGDVGRLRAWLDDGGNPNERDPEGWTPLLWAAARGHTGAVKTLLDHPEHPADPDLTQGKSGALAIHLAGHSGEVGVAKALLEKRPGHLDAIWDLNGHTLILQAVFYGHLDMTAFALEQGCDTAATTVRELTALDLARQYENQEMIALLEPHAPTAEAKAAYIRRLMERIAPVTPPGEEAEQALADRLVEVIQGGIREAAGDRGAVERTDAAVRDLVENQGADPNRLGGWLRQPALVVAVTGNNGVPPNPDVAELRRRVSEFLLEKRADPTLHEDHPMGAHAVIRASVFNHLDILRRMEASIPRERMAEALNEIPVVNGLTALHDTVLRGSMTVPERLGGYLEQIRWAVGLGARYDIEDFSGRTQLDIAEAVENPEVRALLVEALTG